MKRVFLAILLFTAGAHAACNQIPQDAQTWLAANPAWHLVQIEDLRSVDQVNWHRAMAARCPSLIAADFDGTGMKFTVLSVLRRAGSDPEQMILALRGHSSFTLRDAAATKAPAVVMQQIPGVARQWDGGRQVEIRNASVAVVQMGGGVEQFYFSGGKFESIWIVR